MATKHKVKKKETLTGIAKKYGHKDWKAIWNSPDNKKLLKSRGRPEAIKEGDLIVIPMNPKQKKEMEAKLQELNEARNGEVMLCDGFADEVKRLNQKIKYIASAAKREVDSTKDIVKTLEDSLKGMKKWATGVDVAAALTQLGVNLGSLAKTAHKAVDETGSALVNLNQQATKQAIGIAKGPLQGEAIKASGKLKDSDNAAVATIGIIADSWNKMTSPSFWAHTWVQMTENGKSWSDAVTMDIGEDIKKKIKEVLAKSAEKLKKLEKTKKDIESRIPELEYEITACKSRISKYEKEAAALPTS